jgi:tetratricopeptide (TPR) repeat protein
VLCNILVLADSLHRIEHPRCVSAKNACIFYRTLTHEVAYGSLLQERRRVLHARIVEALEVLYPDRLTEQVERLAHHALRGEVWDKALTYGRQAGARAATRSAYREAVVCFEQALAALAHLPECRDTLEQAIDLRCDLRNALLPLAEYGQSLDHLHAAEALAERLGDPQRLAQIACLLCTSFSFIGEHDSAMAAGQRALALATTSGAFDVQVVAQTQLGVAYSAVGDFRQALDFSRRVMASLTGELRYAHFGQAPLPAVVSRSHLTWSLAELGSFAEGSGVGEEAIRIAEEAAHPFSLAVALTWVGLLSRRQGAPRKAIPILERGLALSQTADFPQVFPTFASILGATYALAGRMAEALPLLDQMLERVATGSGMLFQALVLTELSEALLLAGRMDEASALAGRLLELFHTQTGSGYQAHACRLLGEVTAQREPPEAELAEAYFRQALTVAEALGMRPLLAHCHRGLGMLYAKMRQREQAHTELSAAMALYRAMDMSFWLPQAEAVLAQADDAGAPRKGEA